MCLILETLVTTDNGILGVAVLIDDLMEIGHRVEGFNLIVSRSQFLHKRGVMMSFFGGVLAAHAIHQFLLGVVEFIVGVGAKHVALVYSLQSLPYPRRFLFTPAG